MSEVFNIPDEYVPKGDMQRYFGVDFDDTYTACPEAFDVFIKTLQLHGHTAFFVTFRDGETEDIKRVASRLGVGMLATHGRPKHEAAEAHGLTIDVWIDDMPWLIYEGAQ